MATTLILGKTVAFLSFKKRTPHLVRGFSYNGDTSSRGRGRVIGPRLILSSHQKRTHPKSCSEKARRKIQTLAVWPSERSLCIGFILACLHSCGTFPRRISGKGAPENVPGLSWSAFFLFIVLAKRCSRCRLVKGGGARGVARSLSWVAIEHRALIDAVSKRIGLFVSVATHYLSLSSTRQMTHP